jgi:hypothetical protein
VFAPIDGHDGACTASSDLTFLKLIEYWISLFSWAGHRDTKIDIETKQII